MDIAQYFHLKLGRPMPERSADARTFPWDSACGEDCRRAIDAAADMVEHVLAATGDAPALEDIRAICCDTINVYMHG